jgi:hypothetical protein
MHNTRVQSAFVNPQPFPTVSKLASKSAAILCEHGVKALKDLNCLPIDGQLRAEIAAEIQKIPEFSTFM